MNTKLTLRLDDELIRGAKRYAALSGKSVSQLVGDYFAILESVDEAPGVELTPRVRRLLGALAGAAVDEQDYLSHLEDKHR